MKGNVGWAASPSQQGPDLGAERLECAPQVGGVVAVEPAFLGPLAPLFDRDQIDHLPLTQRIGHHMAPRPHMHRGLGGHGAVGGQQRAPGDLTGEEGIAGAVQFRAQDRMQPVGANQKINRTGVFPRDMQHRAGVAQVDPFDAGTGPDRHPLRAGALDQQIQQVGAVKHAGGPGPA